MNMNITSMNMNIRHMNMNSKFRHSYEYELYELFYVRFPLPQSPHPTKDKHQIILFFLNLRSFWPLWIRSSPKFIKHLRNRKLKHKWSNFMVPTKTSQTKKNPLNLLFFGKIGWWERRVSTVVIPKIWKK